MVIGTSNKLLSYLVSVVLPLDSLGLFSLICDSLLSVVLPLHYTEGVSQYNTSMRLCYPCIFFVIFISMNDKGGLISKRFIHINNIF